MTEHGRYPDELELGVSQHIGEGERVVDVASDISIEPDAHPSSFPGRITWGMILVAWTIVLTAAVARVC